MKEVARSPLDNFPLPPVDEASQRLMPNLFVIGASKSGSSALHAYLRVHPEIQMSKEKEPCFFVDQDELENAWPIMARRACSHQWPAYLGLFEGVEDARYRGEGSVYYSQAPHRSGVAERIAKFCPDARIIYTVREPVSRAIGHYWQRFKEFQETLPIDQAMRANAIYRDSSDYALQLQEYRAHFPDSQIKVVIAEDLRSRRYETLADVLEWLEVSPYAYSESEVTDRHKSPKTTRKERFPLVQKFRDSAFWAAIRGKLPAGWVANLREASTTTFEKSQVNESGARDYLHRHLDPRRADFEQMIGRQIKEWGPIEPAATD